MTYYISSGENDMAVDAESLEKAYIVFVRKADKPLGLITIGYHEPFLGIPKDAKPIRTSILMVRAKLWTSREARDFNQRLIGRRII